MSNLRLFLFPQRLESTLSKLTDVERQVASQAARLAELERDIGTAKLDTVKVDALRAKVDELETKQNSPS